MSRGVGIAKRGFGRALSRIGFLKAEMLIQIIYIKVKQKMVLKLYMVKKHPKN
jgi:hypothetical protein